MGAPGRLRLQGYLAHKKERPPRTLQQDYVWGPTVVQGGGAVSYERGTPVEDPYGLLLSEYGASKTVTARFCPWLSDILQTLQVVPSSLGSGLVRCCRSIRSAAPNIRSADPSDVYAPHIRS